MENYLVFDIGGTFIKYALMDENYAILERGKVPSPNTNLEDLVAALEQIGGQYAGRYQAAAISMPGRIDTKRGIAHTGGAFYFIHDVPFAALVQERLSVPVTIANDGKCAANAELLDGALAGVDNGAVLVLGTGTGGGIVLNGRVWMGNASAAGIYAIQTVLDLQRYAIGGGISSRTEVTDTIRHAVDELFAAVPITPFTKPELVCCHYGNDANLIGALRFHKLAVS